MTAVAAERPEEAHEVLRKLVAEICAGDYRDPLRQRLTRNTAFLEACAYLQLREVLEQDA